MLIKGAVLLLAAGTMTACSGGGGAAPSADIDGTGLGDSSAQLIQLYKEARDAGQTKIVIQGPAAAESDSYWKAFEARFPGIKISAQDVAPPETAEKLKAEMASGNYSIDMVATGDTPAAELSADNLCGAVDLVAAKGIDSEWLAMGRTVFIPSISIFGTVYNPAMVKESEVPKSWQDLLDPKWKGKIATGDPSGGGIAGYAFAQMLLDGNKDELGLDYLKKLKAQDLNVVSAEPEIASAVAGKRFPIGILVWKGFADGVIAKGVDLGFQFPMKDKNVTTSDAYCIPPKAPNAKASKLLANWLFTPEGQAAIADSGAYSTMPGAPAPKGLPPLSEVDLMKTPPIDELAATIAPYREEVTAFFQ